VTDIVERWKDGDMEDTVAVEALGTVEESITETESESEELKMNDAEYAIYLFFKEEKVEEIESISQASDIADSITSKFEDRVDRGYSGWKKNQETKTKTLKILIEVFKEYNIKHLLLDDSQTEDTIKNYLIQNYD
jgi:type I restriction enzyme R subunit